VDLEKKIIPSAITPMPAKIHPILPPEFASVVLYRCGIGTFHVEKK
jgi:hypothetical protein